MVTNRQEIYSVIDAERVFQDRKWGTIEEHSHEVGSWLTIMGQLLENAKLRYMSKRGDTGALNEIRKVAAVAVACMEQHGPIHRPRIDFVEQSNNFSVRRKE